MILLTYSDKELSKPAGGKDMATELTQSKNGTWNARSLLTVPEVAEWARVHPKTVYRWGLQFDHKEISTTKYKTE